MNYTSIEQSKKLLELGLKSKSADMFYYLAGKTETPLPNGNCSDYGDFEMPCWSLGALLEITKCCNRLEIHLREDKTWNVFATINNSIFRSFDKLQGKGYKIQFNALYDIVCWLLENKII